jgi:hypothetical protein
MTESSVAAVIGLEISPDCEAALFNTTLQRFVGWLQKLKQKDGRMRSPLDATNFTYDKRN